MCDLDSYGINCESSFLRLHRASKIVRIAAAVAGVWPTLAAVFISCMR